MSYLGLLRKYPNYARLWAASVVSLLGDWFNTIVLMSLVARYSGGSGLAIGGFVLARTLSQLLVVSYAGMFADRFSRKKLMIIADVLRAVVVLGFLLVTGPERLWLIYVLTVIHFGLAAIFDPSRSAIVPNIIEKEDLVLANTLDSATWSAMLTVGGLIGGLVAAILGTTTALIIDSGTFLVSALIITQIHVPPMKEHTDEEGDETPLEDRTILEGLRYARRHPGRSMVLFVKAGANLTSIDTLATVLATQVFVMGSDNGEQALGILFGAMGLGAVLGPLVMNNFNDGQVTTMRRLIVIGFIFITGGWLFMGLFPSLLLASVALCVRAMGASVNWTYSSVIIQKQTPDAFRGRMFSLDMMLFQATAAIATISAGLFIDWIGVDHISWYILGIAAASLLPWALWTAATAVVERREKRKLLHPLSAAD